METKIKAQKDLYNGGKCFTKNLVYTVRGSVNNESGLMDCQTVNDLNEPHIIGSWWRNFKIVK